jgi:hypothetical protein
MEAQDQAKMGRSGILGTMDAEKLMGKVSEALTRRRLAMFG